MFLYVVGSGALAQEIRSACAEAGDGALKWHKRAQWSYGAIVVHTGSGREFEAACRWCTTYRVPMIQAATGIDAHEPQTPRFPFVKAPNLAAEVVVFMDHIMPAALALLDLGMVPELTESHQASKTSVAGTAQAIARPLGLSSNDITSFRDRAEPHAEHRISFRNPGVGVRVELTVSVSGRRAYALGALRLGEQLMNKYALLQNRIYSVSEIDAL